VPVEVLKWGKSGRGAARQNVLTDEGAGTLVGGGESTQFSGRGSESN